MSTSTQGREPVARQAELHIRGSRHGLQSVQCLSQIQDEAAAPPDGISCVSRKTQPEVCFDRQGNSFSLSRLLFSFFPILLVSLLCVFRMAVLLMTVISYACNISLSCCVLRMSVHLYVPSCLLLCVYTSTSFCAFLYLYVSCYI